MNAIEVDDRFQDTKARTIERLGYLEGKICTADELRKMRAVIENVPDRNTFIHGDAHPGNVMLQNGEYRFIDLGGASKGHPVFDTVSMCMTFKIGQYSDEEARNKRDILRGFSIEELQLIWDTYLRTYLDTDDGELLKKAEEQIIAITCARVILAAISIPGLFTPEKIAFFKKTVLDHYDKGIEPLCF